MSRKREDLVVPYHHFPAKPRAEAGSMISQTLPMAAILVLAIQSYLSEPINKPQDDSQAGSQPPLLRVVFALVSLSTCYLDIFFPSTNPAIKKSAIAQVSETVSSVVSEATS
ncbi:hypothetical protein CJJ09_003954 [Candidozyma auris]|nr:hypothetical protein CJJ09_003954 [[Candida] auris]